MGKFCDQGHCGECLSSNGAGCAAEEYCSSTGCHNEHVPGAAKCHKRADLDSDCEIRLNEMGATCNVHTLVCESAKQTTTPDAAAAAETVAETSGGTAGVATAAYENPDGNYFFCGASYAALSDTCLQSKVSIPWHQLLFLCDIGNTHSRSTTNPEALPWRLCIRSLCGS